MSTNRENTPGRPHSDRGQGQAGGEPVPPYITNAARPGRFEWSYGLRDDLLECYEGSSPARRGYMSRMHVLWCQKHPEHADFTQQKLRDYVSYLRRIGHVRVARQQERPAPAATPPQQQAAERPAPVVSADFRTRRGLNSRTAPKLAQLAEADARLSDELPEDADILDINCAVYHAVERLATRERQDVLAGCRDAERQVRQLVSKIHKARQHASRIQCVVEYITAGRTYTKRIKRIVRGLRRRHHTVNKAVLLTTKQHCLDRVRVLVARKRAIVKGLRGRKENAIFLSNPSHLFKTSEHAAGNPPRIEDVQQFWKGIYETKRPFREDTPAMAHLQTFLQNVEISEEESQTITAEEVRSALAGTKNFSAPGPDGIVNFYWKKFTRTHGRLARVFDSWLNGGQPIPQWFVEGRTVLLPKKGDLSRPGNYRPITCLNTCYKMFTRILYLRVLRAVDPVFRRIYEQRGAKKGLAGCKENLLVDRCVSQDAIQYKRNLSMAWIDYRKAFDTTSHQLLVYLLERLAVPAPLVRCIEHLLPLWRTRFTITSGDTRVSTEPVTYRRGVFQGDSLSPLLFCISLLPLSVALRQTRGYSVGPPNNRRHGVTHLLYMDDIKLYASGEGDLQQALRVVEEYTRDIGMEFGLDKCAVLHLRRGRGVELGGDMELVDGGVLHHLDAGETYAYLGIAQRNTQDACTVKTALRGKYRHLLRQIWSSELSGKNKVSATNMLAVPVLLYSFGVVKWTVDELRELDRSTRKMMHLHRCHHPNASVPRLYLSRQQGGRGLLSLECLHGRVALGMACNVIRSSDPLLQLVYTHEVAGKGAFLFKAASRAAEELGLAFEFGRGGQPVAGSQPLIELDPKRLKETVKAAEQRMLLRRHVDKPMHGVFFKNMEDVGLSTRLTFSFLRSAGLKSETEGFIVACQDGVYNTLVYRSRVMGVEVPDISCRACHTAPESLMHLLSACPTYATSAYIHRHNAALRVLYFHIRHAYGVDETPQLPYAPGDIESVVGNAKCQIYWNYAFPTVRLISANKPDVVLLDRETKAMFVVEFSAPAEKNIALKEEEKRTKYRDFLYELRTLYPGYKVQLVVLIIGALGGIRTTLLSALQAIPCCRDSAEFLAARMQRAVILGSMRLLRAHETATCDR